MFPATHLYVSGDSPVCFRRLTCMFPVTHLYVSGDSPICFRQLTYMFPATHLYVSGNSPVCFRRLEVVPAQLLPVHAGEQVVEDVEVALPRALLHDPGLLQQVVRQHGWRHRERERNVLFNDALNTFHLR